MHQHDLSNVHVSLTLKPSASNVCLVVVKRPKNAPKHKLFSKMFFFRWTVMRPGFDQLNLSMCVSQEKQERLRDIRYNGSHLQIILALTHWIFRLLSTFFNYWLQLLNWFKSLRTCETKKKKSDFLFILYIIHHNHSLNHYSGFKCIVCCISKSYPENMWSLLLLPSIITPVLWSMNDHTTVYLDN